MAIDPVQYLIAILNSDGRTRQEEAAGGGWY